MVLKQLVEEELEEVKSNHLENPDYGERIDKILETHSCFPVGDKYIEKRLEGYSEELNGKDKEVSKEGYISELEDTLESKPDCFR